ncbi:nuclear transport factor 2 family protein [Microtetraspora fusca]|uniref:nuclear transport factor 2 family protein n=1 Tax=Microtetraspora fusca TaxID=1997 RepID=UPI000B1A718F|nr:nuclear transport factor 2 family protein [Microtetraspora fusca]
MGEPLLSAELTRAAVARYVDALNAHDADAIAACVSPDFVNEHTSPLGRSVTGRDGYRANLTGFLADFADLHYAVEDLIVEDCRAALAYRMSFRLLSAGGKPVAVRGVFRLQVGAHGLITHRTDYWDSGEVRRQLADPAP